MPLSSITQVLLRLSALNWLITGLVQLVTTISAFQNGSLTPLHFSSPVIVLFAGAVCWIFAPILSVLLTGRLNRAFSLQGVTLEALYSTAFVSLGLWFALSNLGHSFNWIHYYISYASTDEGLRATRSNSFYDMTKTILTFLAGVALVATGHIWARKLAKMSERAGAANPHAFGTFVTDPADAGSAPKESGDT